MPQGAHPVLCVPIHFDGAVPHIGPKAPPATMEPLPIQELIQQARTWQLRLKRGNVTRAELAEEHGCSRTRVTQILNLLKLAPVVLERIVEQDPLEAGVRGITEHRLRGIINTPEEHQLRMLEQMLSKARIGKTLREQRLRKGMKSGRRKA